MELKNQVCSLELAKKLKELGVKQESLFYHIFQKNYPSYIQISNECQSGVWLEGTDVISAFTVAELGEMLPDCIKTYYHLNIHKQKNSWSVSYGEGEYENSIENTEADARAKMLIYLLENNLK